MMSIEFDGVYENSEVWINGQYLGKRPNGYINFCYENPYLYTSHREVRRDGREVDRYETPFGIREIAFDAGLLDSGSPNYLRLPSRPPVTARLRSRLCRLLQTGGSVRSRDREGAPSTATASHNRLRSPE
jgi:hypothetical protein